MANCKKCNAPILFKYTSKGALMPIDAAPIDDGNIIINAQGTVTVLTKALIAQGFAEGQPRYRSHFSTCKFANLFKFTTEH